MPDILANDPISTLSASMDGSQTTLSVASAATFPTVSPFTVRVEDELMRVTGISGTTFTVTRAQEGTSAAAHGSGVDISQVITRRTLDTSLDYYENGMRISVSSSDDCPWSASNSSTLYIHPRRPIIGLMYGGRMERCEVNSVMSPTMLSLTDGATYDVFLYYNSSNHSVATEFVAWTNASTRSVALTKINGAAFKSSDTTRRYIGTIALAADGFCYDTPLRRMVSNYDNREIRTIQYFPSFGNYSLSGGVSRMGLATDAVHIVCGDVGRNTLNLSAFYTCSVSGASGTCSFGIGVDSTSAFSSDASIGFITPGNTTIKQRLEATIRKAQLGTHVFETLYSTSGSNTVFYGDNGFTRNGWVGYTLG